MVLPKEKQKEMVGRPVITGYYRFTDIFFEWHKALPNPEDISPLKASISYDALVHPDHPLRNGREDGIELFIGTFESGEARLLMSSAQIEYLRYWLHTVELTKEIIPIPSSEYLIKRSDLRTCSPAIHNNAEKLKKAVRNIEKANKKLKGSQPRLTSRRIAFEKIRTFWGAKTGTWLAVDFEAWEMDHNMITEFGWSLVTWENGQDVRDKAHLIIQERRGYYNHKYVRGNRDHYNFGESRNVNKATFKQTIHDLINQYTAKGPLFLIFHNSSQDMIYFQSKDINAPLTGFQYFLPEAAPTEGIFIVDTAELFAGLEGESGGNTRGLERTARLLGIEVEYDHNAGNDAHYTMMALEAMASGDPIDAQREKRWPDRLSVAGPKVEFKPSDENSDLEDEDEIKATQVRTIDPEEMDGEDLWEKVE